VADVISEYNRVRRCEGFFLERECCKDDKIEDHTNISILKKKRAKTAKHKVKLMNLKQEAEVDNTLE